ncbi:MAG: hypothetical protein CFE24_01405 [Flavobacterium sp. BFFFF2]|nr:MAG: hypothetical protein CFE24_01405 [Flavobacterium sp. BFFFF2]
MINPSAKVIGFVLLAILFTGCNAVRRVPNGKRLLVSNVLSINGKPDNSEAMQLLLSQKPNSTLLGYPLRLNLYNLAKPHSDSLFREKLRKNPKRYQRYVKVLSKKQVYRLSRSFYHFGIHEFLRKTGEPPVLIDTMASYKSIKRLKSHYFNQGFFDVEASFSVDTISNRKAKITYKVALGASYKIDSIKTQVASPVLDSMYQKLKTTSLIRSGDMYHSENLTNEIKRLVNEFRNQGVFYFQPNNIRYVVDTLSKQKKAHIELYISDQSIRKGDSIKTVPFKRFKISTVRVITDFTSANENKPFKDSITYNHVTLYGYSKIKFVPKALVDAVFILPGTYYSDTNTINTAKFLSNLKVFKYPLIQYLPDPKNENALIATIFLSMYDNFKLGYGIDFTHSNIIDFGINGFTSITVRNVFHGAETFVLGFRGNVGSSKDLANPNNNFFNVSEIGADAQLNFPKILMPFNTDKLIPKRMIPSSSLSIGVSKQRNIGLDKESVNATFTYNWSTSKSEKIRLDLFNIQYVKNINTANYYNVYRSSYDVLNNISKNYTVNPTYFDENNNLIVSSGVNSFLNDVNNGQVPVTSDELKTVRSIEERQYRLTENNLISSTAINYWKSTKKDLFDNNFYSFRTKVEAAGNGFSLLANLSKQLKNQNGANTIFEIEYAQYIKTEAEFIKHWDLHHKKVFAVRSFAGIAIPYGNSRSIPFSRSYFAGGSNDIRGWQSYGLGPGASGSVNDFNEANLKLLLCAEFRFQLLGKLNGALFADAGNIWNVLDAVEDEKYVFKGIKSLEYTALATGFGFRYDLPFFSVRLDFGYKTYNPANSVERRWGKDVNFSQSVLNVGINYPF